jgi:Rne/Rng family ribonuclease
MATELIINSSLPETRIAMVEDGEIQELLIERASGRGIVGNIYKGRVTRVLPGMQAAFVDIGLDKAAFLYVDDVFVHSEIWEDEEGSSEGASEDGGPLQVASDNEETASAVVEESAEENASVPPSSNEQIAGDVPSLENEVSDESSSEISSVTEQYGQSAANEVERFSVSESSEESLDDQESLSEGEDEEDGEELAQTGDESPLSSESQNVPALGSEGERTGRRRRHRRGRRGGRGRRGNQAQLTFKNPSEAAESSALPHHVVSANMDEAGHVVSDRGAMAGGGQASLDQAEGVSPDEIASRRSVLAPVAPGSRRPEFQMQRSRDRRIKPKEKARGVREQVSIQNLLKEGQEVIVQVAKDPIATKGARLTCHISLPGRHLVCMPTIDHVGVSRRIEREDERRKLRDAVERNRPKKLGFIVRTASGKGNSEQRIKQDIDYLSRLWEEIREKAASVSAPSMVYEDLNSVLRAIRDWVTEDIDKVIVDSRHHFSEIQRFVGHFMPSLRSKVDLYHGDIPIFDAYGISTELARALERKVWLKSGGYLVIDQAEALVAIDVNTGRFVGKKNLEDTILKTNLEAVEEIAYQLRLRNCGGIIVLDLIDMEKEENKQRVYRALEEALKKDRARPSIQKISDLGLIEMTRKRTRDTIIRTLCEPCSHCEGKGYIKNKQTVAYEALREIERDGIERDANKILVQAHPEVIDILAIEERDTIDLLERRYKKQVYLQAVYDFHPEQFEVASERKDRPAGAERENYREFGRDRGRGRDRDRNRDRNRGSQGASLLLPSSESTGTSSRELEGAPLESGESTDMDSIERAYAAESGEGLVAERSESLAGNGGDLQGEAQGRNRHGRDRNRRQGRDRDRNRDRERGPGAQQPQAPKGLIAPRSTQAPVNTAPDSVPVMTEGASSDVAPNQLISANGSSEIGFQPRRAQLDSSDEMIDGLEEGSVDGDSDEGYEEEDRLAFLRAQAAQDAALASFGAHASPGSQNAGGPATSGRPPGGAQNRRPGGRRRRGRRGGGGRGGPGNGAPNGTPSPSGGGNPQ